jgi:hypothetical protein
MVGVGNTGDEIVVAGSHNVDWLHRKFRPDPGEPRKLHIMLCRAVAMPAQPAEMAQVTVTLPSTFGAKVQALFTGGTPTRDYISEEIRLSDAVLKPALDGGNLVVTGEWRIDKTGEQGFLRDDDIIIRQGRKSRSHVRVRLPPQATPKLGRKVQVTLELQAVVEAEGAANGDEIMVKYAPGKAPAFNDTIVHEIGHSLNQTPGNGKQPVSIPDHPHYFPHNGSHCCYGYYRWPRRPCCVMYEYPDASCIHRFCEVCTPYLLVEDMSSIVYGDDQRR